MHTVNTVVYSRQSIYLTITVELVGIAAIPNCTSVNLFQTDLNCGII